MATASELKKNNYFMHAGEPMRVVRKELVAYGTHSHSKLKLFIQGLNSKGEKIVTMHHHDKVDMIDIIRKKGQVIAKVGEGLQVMDSVNYETFDAQVEQELGSQINEGDEVTFIDVLGSIQVIDKREG